MEGLDHQWIDASRMPELGREAHSLELQLGDVLAFDLKIILSETVVAVNHPTVVVVGGRAVRLCRTKGTLLLLWLKCRQGTTERS